MHGRAVNIFWFITFLCSFETCETPHKLKCCNMGMVILAFKWAVKWDIRENLKTIKLC